jgi:phenylacetate-CoA ligase
MPGFPLEAIEKAPLAELRKLQLQRLQWSLHHAYENVAHYRKKFDAAGVKPEDCRTLADLHKFPFTTKADLRETYPFGMFAVPMDKIVRIHASSGTTGKPTVVGYTAKDIDTWTHVMARSIRAAGAEPGMKVHVAYGYGLFTGGLGAHYGAERLGLAVIPLGGGMTERQVQLITDFKPEIIMVTPSYMLAIADEMERQGIDPKTSSLKIGIFGAEPWTNEMRKQIEARTSLAAIDIYGLSEVMGPGVAQECVETKDGLTIWEDHFLPEIVDPESGKPLPEGEAGELVFTSLSKEALPVIRYRTRDLTRLLPGTARTMRRMEKITGRSDDMLIIRGVNVFPSQVEELILKHSELAPHYVLELSKEGPLDQLAVLIEMTPENEGWPEARKSAAAHTLQHDIKSLIGVTTDVRVVPTNTIERSIGKAKRVIDKRPKA